MPHASTLKADTPRIPDPAHADVPVAPPVRPFAMLSHPGRVRHSNEDACGARPERGIFVVCDGMGGAAAGEVASHFALEAFLDSLTRVRPFSPKSTTRPSGPPDAGGFYPDKHPYARVEEAVRAANQAVHRHSQKSRTLRGMGTTLVGFLLEDTAQRTEDATAVQPTLWLAHVGDSRCYQFRSGALLQLTRDHSLVEEQIQAGLISRIDAESSPVRNIITRAVGSLPTVEPEIAAHPAQPGDLYLLASDGLTRELSDAEISAILARARANTLDIACQSLIDAANASGGHDNITVLLVYIP